MKRIDVTKTFLPAIADYEKYLEMIWQRGQITNHGPLVEELENRLAAYLDVKHVFLVTNGTIALQIAIKAVGLKNEILTSAFSYVATSSSIAWLDCVPVLCDIDPHSFCVDPAGFEERISDKTTGILATHVYGNLCDVEAIAEIARKKNLRVIYDAAHAFGVKYKGRPIFQWGDCSSLSFHATKIFHTIEGGAVVTNDDEIAHKISYMRNFGHKGQEEFWGLGINGKASEFQAAMGLCVLPHVEEMIRERKVISDLYDSRLAMLVTRPQLRTGVQYNYAYYPSIFESAAQAIHVRDRLNAENIFPRRYFYPSLSTLNYVSKPNTPIADDIAQRVLCLPIGPDVTESDIHKICDIIIQAL